MSNVPKGKQNIHYKNNFLFSHFMDSCMLINKVLCVGCHQGWLGIGHNLNQLASLEADRKNQTMGNGWICISLLEREQQNIGYVVLLNQKNMGQVRKRAT